MFEFKRNFKAKNIILFVILGLGVLLLGLVLPVTIDKVAYDKLSYSLAAESVYTVYTQFGIFIFSAIIINFISDDYKEKTIYFYKKLNFNPVIYYLEKVLLVISLLGITSLVSSLALSVLFKNFQLFAPVFLKTLAVLILFAIMSCFFAFVFDNFVKAFIVNFIFWLVGNLLSAGRGFWEYFCYYDAANTNYNIFISFLDGKDVGIGKLLLTDYAYDLVVLILCLILIFIFKKKWIKNGI